LQKIISGENMDYLFVVLGTLCILVGIAGSILPGLPGPPLGFLGLLLMHWTRFADYPASTLAVLGILVVVTVILDYVVPIWGTKKFGGTRAGVRGSTIGLIVGVILLPMLGIVLGPFGLIGILGGPFIGAWIGERSSGQSSDKALRSALGSFLGFVAGTMMKLAVCFILAFYFFRSVWQAVF
jgi:uncharacterized protein YqgC (DUF456 family)